MILKLSKNLDSTCRPHLVRKANMILSLKSITSCNGRRNCRTGARRQSGKASRVGGSIRQGSEWTGACPAGNPRGAQTSFSPCAALSCPALRDHKNVSVTTAFLHSPKSLIIFFFLSDPTVKRCLLLHTRVSEFFYYLCRSSKKDEYTLERGYSGSRSALQPQILARF